MSVQPKEVKSNIKYSTRAAHSSSETRSGRVNLRDLVQRLNEEKKKERKGNLLISLAAISAVVVFGIILSL